jgi:hypothetical protein
MIKLRDKTELIPFILFAIFVGVITFCIIKGTRKGTVQMKEDVLYIKPSSETK